MRSGTRCSAFSAKGIHAGIPDLACLFLALVNPKTRDPSCTWKLCFSDFAGECFPNLVSKRLSPDATSFAHHQDLVSVRVFENRRAYG